MASIAFKNVDGSTLSRVRIMKDGRALETFPVTPGTPMRTWPSMDAWVQELPREWPRVEAWTRVPLTLTREKARRLYYTKQKQKAVVAGPALAYFLKLPEGGMTNREEVREALASYMDFYKWGMSVYRTKRDVRSDTPLYHLDDFLVTLTRLDPRGTYTARQILNAVLAWQTWTAPAVAPAVDEETPLGSLGPKEETPSVPQEETPSVALGPLEETPSAEDLAWHILRIMGENKRLKAEIEALQARLCTIRAAACI
jgi:hypothetical protein